METWSSGVPFRETLRKHAADSGQTLDETRLDEVCRPERYIARLDEVFDRVAALT
jgi:adenylosuccinate lyase